MEMSEYRTRLGRKIWLRERFVIKRHSYPAEQGWDAVPNNLQVAEYSPHYRAVMVAGDPYRLEGEALVFRSTLDPDEPPVYLRQFHPSDQDHLDYLSRQSLCLSEGDDFQAYLDFQERVFQPFLLEAWERAVPVDLSQIPGATPERIRA